MNHLPPIGTRVKFTRNGDPERVVTGTVTDHYPSYGERIKDPETGEVYDMVDHVCLKVDSIPKWWPYPDTDLIAPEITEIELIKKDCLYCARDGSSANHYRHSS